MMQLLASDIAAVVGASRGADRLQRLLHPPARGLGSNIMFADMVD